MTLEFKLQRVRSHCLRAVQSSVVALFGLGAIGGAEAALTVNAAGTLAGFSLSTYYSDPAVTYGVLSLANGPGGFLYAAGYARGDVYKFANVDGQSFGTQVATASTPGTPTGIASVGGQVYLGVLGGGLLKVDGALAFTPLVIVAQTFVFDYGLWGNAVTGHLLASTSTGLIDIDPISGIWTQIGPAGEFVDGVTVSPDGKVAYGAYTGSQAIRGYSLASPNPAVPVFDTGFLGHGPDGTGVISGGLFDGDIIVNNNDGTVGLIDKLTGIETIIADGGSRGDLVSADLSNGTLLLDQSESVLRLSCGPGCAIGGPPPAAPEPLSLALVGMALTGLAATRRRKSV